ncbi:MAG: transcriptional regulator [Planctomycetaceae bacterium]|nr:MAG: transcriptional regulator [Planctomycetaceae bacterium]
MKARTLTHDDIPENYAELVGLSMPRPLHDDVDYRNALAVLDAIAGFKMNADQQDYFEAIATFVEKYETEHHAINDARMTPVELIRSLVDEHDMSESDLGRLLGDRSLGHRILTGQRELSKSHIRILAEHFSLNPAALLK